MFKPPRGYGPGSVPHYLFLFCAIVVSVHVLFTEVFGLNSNQLHCLRLPRTGSREGCPSNFPRLP
jgi:hypothetical protein